MALNRKPTVPEYLGDYKLHVTWGEATLRINADGTFQERIIEKGKSLRNVFGRWQSRDGENFLSVDFRPFGMVWDENHDSETSIYGINFYKPHFGATYGLINSDLGEEFKRQ